MSRADADWISYEEALGVVLESVRELGSERVPLARAQGRILAADIVSRVAHPPWDNSAMDGFAVRAGDVEGAAEETPVRLPISDDIPAGRFPAGPLAAGTAARVMTGAPVPEGASGVIRVEHTDGGTGREVAIFRATDARRNIRRRGEDIRPGEPLLDSGREIDAAGVAVLALTGEAVVEVGRRPRIGVLANGDELAGLDAFEDVLAGRRIMNTNGPALVAQSREAGAEAVDLGIASDDPEDLAERIERGRDLDGLVSAAGVSVGERDYVRDVLSGFGFERLFWRVRMRPGSAMLFGLLEGRPVWGVPGNPVSAMVGFETLVRPAVRAMAGASAPLRRRIRCRTAEGVSGPADVTSFLRVRLRGGRDGDESDDVPVVELTGPQGSGILTSMLADGLLVLPEGVSELEPGAICEVIPLREWRRPARAAPGIRS